MVKINSCIAEGGLVVQQFPQLPNSDRNFEDAEEDAPEQVLPGVWGVPCQPHCRYSSSVWLSAGGLITCGKYTAVHFERMMES